MRFVLFILSILVGLLGGFLLVTMPLQGIIGGVIFVLAGVLFSGAAIVDAINRVERVIRAQQS